MRYPYDRWTPEEIAELRRLRDETTLTMREISVQMGRTLQACELVASRERMPRRQQQPRTPVWQVPKVRRPIDPDELLRRGISPQTVAILRRIKR